MKTKLTSAATIESDHEYHSFERLIADRIASISGPLFTTDAIGLFDVYLENLPEESRQHYNCHACRRFIDRYGPLAQIGENGDTEPTLNLNLLSVPTFFRSSFSAMMRKIGGAKVTGVFLDSSAVWGTPQTGEWSHLSGRPVKPYKDSPLKNAGQAMAEKYEEYGMLCRGIADFPLEAAIQAVRVLEADVIDRSEKTLGVAQWFLKLHRNIEGERGQHRSNLIWLAVATAPPGWCHVRTTMIGTLLEDVIQGLPFDRIQKRWADKMHPLQYQRPTAISDGALKAANEAVEKLGSAGSLQRRFAKLSEVTALWRPREIPEAQKANTGGAFDHLMTNTKKIKKVELPPTKMAWDKFRDAVLPSAFQIECMVPHSGGFFGLVTAVNADAPPILQWDGLEGLPRNPVSWYFHHPFGEARGWNLQPGWTTVAAAFLKPCHWQDAGKFSGFGSGIFLALAGAKDVRGVISGSFFPECLRSEYHDIRAAMEAYSKAATIAGRDEGDANGICLDGKNELRVRVRGDTGSATEYFLSLG